MTQKITAPRTVRRARRARCAPRTLCALLALAVLLSACATGGASPASFSGPQAGDTPAAEVADALLAQIAIYEQCSYGEAFSLSATGEPVSEFSGYEAFAVGYYDTLPGRHPTPELLGASWELYCSEINALFFDAPAGYVAYQTYDYEVEVELLSATYIDDGQVEVTIARRWQGRELWDNRYILAPAAVSFEPRSEFLQGLAQGDIVYRFVSVQPIEPVFEGGVVDLSTPGDLTLLAAAVNGSDPSYRGNTYRLVSDIDMTSFTMPPIGAVSEAYPYYGNYGRYFKDPDGFCAVFEGQGYKISGYTLESAAPLAGFFGLIGEGATVRDLRLEDVSIINRTPSTENSHTGGLAGEAKLGATVENCRVSGTVQGTGYTGGLIGVVRGPDGDGPGFTTIYNCITDVAVTAERHSGGFIGAMNGGEIRDCAAYGTFTLKKAAGAGYNITVGGFAGELNADIYDSHSGVVIFADIEPYRMGSFVGELLSVSLYNCTIEQSSIRSGWYNVGWQWYRTSIVELETVINTPPTEVSEALAESAPSEKVLPGG